MGKAFVGINPYSYANRVGKPFMSTNRHRYADRFPQFLFRINPYTYASNDPANRIDPDGLKDWGMVVGGTLVVVGSVAEAYVGVWIITIGYSEIALGNMPGIIIGPHTIGAGGAIFATSLLNIKFGSELITEGWKDNCKE